VLLVEDSDVDAGLVASHLQQDGATVFIDRVDSRGEYVERLSRGGFDIILSGLELPGFDGRTALQLARRVVPDTPFIYVSDRPGEELAVASLKDGAADYVLKQGMARLPAAVERALAEARERAERRQAEEQLRALACEVDHRMKNMLATVASIARLTLRRSRTLEEFEGAFLGRLGALADAQALVSGGDTDMRRILERSAAPFVRDDRGFRLEGPPLRLPPKPALSLSLVFHELAANAARHGALSSAEGVVRVVWTIGSSGRVHIRWSEENGPPVQPPRSKGFGARLIERSARHDLDGWARLDFAPAGLDCRLDFPLDRRAATEGEDLPDLA